eukprot:9460777-Alexandrium_andersonii.AAC.1
MLLPRLGPRSSSFERLKQCHSFQGPTAQQPELAVGRSCCSPRHLTHQLERKPFASPEVHQHIEE